MSFPHEEVLADLVGDRDYAEVTRWRVFKELSPDDLPGTNVLLVLGRSWTIMSAADFKAAAKRILKQLD